MRLIFQICLVPMLIFGYSNTDPGTLNERITLLEESQNSLTDSICFTGEANPRMSYVIYGYYCGECVTNCTRMYVHHLLGNKTTFWTDTTDSYFSGTLDFQTEMNDESEKLGSDLLLNIPDSFFATDSVNNVLGCPDCDDGCGLYFEFKLADPNSKPITFKMEYSLNNTSGQVKRFGELMRKTIDELEKYR